VEMAGGSNPKAGVDTFVRRRSIKQETPQGPERMGREASSGGGEVVRPGTGMRPGTGATGRKSLDQAATSEGASLRPTARHESTSSRRSISPERLSSCNSSESSRESLRPKERSTFFRPLKCQLAPLPTVMAHRRSVVPERRVSISDLTQQVVRS
jgi:hypothetical protein